MSLFAQLLGIAALLMMSALLLLVIFGQVTVRKLRKNPATKDYLGLEFASGWDILNVAQTLSMPKTWSKKLQDSPLAFLEADSQVLYRHTTVFDRVLGRVFYGLLVTSVCFMLILVVLDAMGFWD